MRWFCMFDDLQSVSVSYREWVFIQQQKRDAAQTHYHCDQWVLLHLFCALHWGVCVWDRARLHDADPSPGKGFILLESWFWYVRQCHVHVSKKGKSFFYFFLSTLKTHVLLVFTWFWKTISREGVDDSTNVMWCNRQHDFFFFNTYLGFNLNYVQKHLNKLILY